jgi:hypothetical protein
MALTVVSGALAVFTEEIAHVGGSLVFGNRLVAARGRPLGAVHEKLLVPMQASSVDDRARRTWLRCGSHDTRQPLRLLIVAAIITRAGLSSGRPMDAAWASSPTPSLKTRHRRCFLSAIPPGRR